MKPIPTNSPGLVHQKIEEARMAVNAAARALHVHAAAKEAEEAAVDLSQFALRMGKMVEALVGATGRETPRTVPTPQVQAPAPKRRFRAHG